MPDVILVIANRVTNFFEKINPGQRAHFRREKSNLRAEFNTIQYENLYPHDFRPVTLQTSTYINNTSSTNKQTFTVDKTTTSTFSYTFKESIETKLSAKVNIPFGEFGLEMTLNFESTQSQTTSEERSWTYATEINIPPKKKVETSFVVQEGLYRVPFTARVQIRGNVYVDFEPSNQFSNAEISDLIEHNKWDSKMFDYDIAGTFEAVNGVNYIVEVNEFDLDEPSRAAVHSVVDSGVMYVHRDFDKLLLPPRD